MNFAGVFFLFCRKS